jgi:hypothetical protein
VGFERLREDAPEAERAYANYLDGRLQPQDMALLPYQHRHLPPDEVSDSLARLIVAGIAVLEARVESRLIESAIDVATLEGWRRPLMAWLSVQAKRAESAGDLVAAQQIERRINLVSTLLVK